MNREEILALNKKENEGKADEYELKVLADASKLAMMIGAFICMLISVVRHFLKVEQSLDTWCVYTTMAGILYLYKYKKLGKKQDLSFGLIYSFCAVGFGVVLIISLIQGWR